MGVKVRTE